MGFLTPKAQAAKNLDGGHLTVERVEVQAIHKSRLQEFFAEFICLVDAIVSDGLIIAFDGVNCIYDVLRHFQLGEFDYVMQRLVGLQSGENITENDDRCFTVSNRMLSKFRV